MNDGRARYIAVRLALGIGAIALSLGCAEFTSRFFYSRASEVDDLVPGVPGVQQTGFFRKEYDWRISRQIKPKSRVSPLPVRYDPSTVRIAIFGESATAGVPFHGCLSFSNFLQCLLSYRFPRADVQVFNFGVSNQTYEFVGQAAQDALSLHPDLLIFYCGNNETIRTNVYWSFLRGRSWFKHGYRLDKWLSRHSVAYALLCDRIHHWKVRPADAACPADFDAVRNVNASIAAFSEVTDEIIAAARKAGAHVIYLTPLRNLETLNKSDVLWPPMTDREAAKAINSSTIAFEDEVRLGQYYLDRHLLAQAKRYLIRANDIQGGNCCSGIEEFIRNIPARYPGVRTIDLEEIFENRLGSVVGWESLSDFCHLNLEAHFSIADILSSTLAPELSRRFGPPVLGPVHPNQALRGDSSSYREWRARGLETAAMANMYPGGWPQARRYLMQSQSLRSSLKGAVALVVVEERIGLRQSADLLWKQLLKSFSRDQIAGEVVSYFERIPELRAVLDQSPYGAHLRSLDGAASRPGSPAPGSPPSPQR